MNGLQINTDIEYSVNLRQKTLSIGYCQCFLLSTSAILHVYTSIPLHMQIKVLLCGL